MTLDTRSVTLERDIPITTPLADHNFAHVYSDVLDWFAETGIPADILWDCNTVYAAPRSGFPMEARFTFDNDADAVHFKMRWG